MDSHPDDASTAAPASSSPHPLPSGLTYEPPLTPIENPRILSAGVEDHECAIASGSDDNDDLRKTKDSYHALANPAVWKLHPPREPLPEDQRAAIATLLQRPDEPSREKLEKDILHILGKYSVSKAVLTELMPKKVMRPFSTAKYWDLAPVFRLNSHREGDDIQKFEVFRSRLSPALAQETLRAVAEAEFVYGRMGQHKTEWDRDRFVRSIYTKVLSLFHGRLLDRSEGMLDSLLTGDDRNEHLFVGFGSVSSFYLEMKMSMGRDGSSGLLCQHAQVMAEALAVNFQNYQLKKWVPVLGAIGDGHLLRFYVYDSASTDMEKPSLYCSKILQGLPIADGCSIEDYAEGVLRVAEYFYDFLILTFINSMRAFLSSLREESVIDGVEMRRDTMERCEKAVLLAEETHLKLRMAARVQDDGMAEEALKLLKSAVELSPDLSDPPKRKRIHEIAETYLTTYTRKKWKYGEED